MKDNNYPIAPKFAGFKGKMGHELRLDYIRRNKIVPMMKNKLSFSYFNYAS
jgi:hypothetical protein